MQRSDTSRGALRLGTLLVVLPAGVAARITSRMAIGTTDVDTARFPRTPDGWGWASPDFEANPNRVEIAVRGGVGQVSIG